MQLKELPSQGTFELKGKAMDVLVVVRTFFEATRRDATPRRYPYTCMPLRRFTDCVTKI